MDARSILTAHIRALDGELEQARAGLCRIHESLRNRVQNHFGGQIDAQLRELEYARDKVDKGKPLDECWTRFRNIRTRCQPILNECLALTQGALARDAGLDGELCRIADFLLDGLSSLGLSDLYGRWGRFTILAEGEFFGEMAAVIRLRYPETSIWNLPVAAHEFGHFVVWRTEEQCDDARFEDYIQEYQNLLPRPPSGVEDEDTLKLYEQKQRMFLHEYYADIFATYALGPAYAYTCLLLRFDPQTAYEDWRAHPSAQKRAHAILKTLEEMDRDSAGHYSDAGIIEDLPSWWQSSLEAACPKGQPAKTEPIEDLVAELYYRLREKMPEVRYDGWPRAARLSRRLTNQNSTQALRDGDTLRDALNAAWRCRIWNNDDLDDSAKALCEKVVLSDQVPKDAV